VHEHCWLQRVTAALAAHEPGAADRLVFWRTMQLQVADSVRVTALLRAWAAASACPRRNTFNRSKCSRQP
jgi:hypothetical protein